jgi:hypothetical protein
MATITTLKKSKEQPSLEVSGQLITLSERWEMILSPRSSSTVTASAVLLAVGNTITNTYGWLRISLDPHPDNSTIRVVDIDIERHGEKDTKFIITTSLTNDKDTISFAQRAVDAPAFYSYQDVDTIEEVDVDPITGEVVAASNGEAYFPKSQAKGTMERIIVTRNETSYDSNRARPYKNKLNKDNMTINGRNYIPRSVMLESWTGDNAFDNDGSEYWKVKYSVLIDEDLHKVELIDAASGPDKDGIHPQSVAWGGAVPVKPYKLGKVSEGDGLYMSRDDQQDASLFYTRSFNLNAEIAMNSVLRL